MSYRSLRECVEDLHRVGQLRVLDFEVDPRLELGMIQRRVCRAGGPALLFNRVKATRFPVLANLFGTLDRGRYVLRHGYRRVEALVTAKVDPGSLVRKPLELARLPLAATHLLPRFVKSAPVMETAIELSELPQVVSWPQDGGAFILLPQVYTEEPARPAWYRSNLGMYRVQLGGNEYLPDREVGMHYQIHRGIGVHHHQALALGRPLKVNVFVGGPPAMTLAAVMPLPEGMPEICFAGVLGGRAVRLWREPGRPALAAEADFVLSGEIHPGVEKPEGPFGDHLGYYSLQHSYPVMRVERVWARRDAIWPITTVGRPPQEDSVFGALIHELTAPILPTVLPGVHAVHAVDEAGVHPLLLAQASERYVPYRGRRRPQELLTAANAILGQGQLSLAKYLLVVAREDDPHLDIHDSRATFLHLLRRVDWRTDLHFQTQTTIDTLDYSGQGVNQGSKVVIAAVGEARRELTEEIPNSVPKPFSSPRLVAPGILALEGPPFKFDAARGGDPAFASLEELPTDHSLRDFPLLVVGEDSDFLAQDFGNFLWSAFTRSNPATDLYGVEPFTYQKHWGCRGPLILDARPKPHHAPVLVEDPALVERVEALAARGGPLQGLF